MKKTGGGAVDDKVAQHVALLNGNPEAPASKIVCSNLRRAVTTIGTKYSHCIALAYIIHCINSTDILYEDIQLAYTSIFPSFIFIISHLSTKVGGFKDRLARNNNREKILIVPSLQEISRNPDTVCIRTCVPFFVEKIILG